MTAHDSMGRRRKYALKSGDHGEISPLADVLARMFVKSGFAPIL
jgi:hypothetical protein